MRRGRLCGDGDGDGDGDGTEGMIEEGSRNQKERGRQEGANVEKSEENGYKGRRRESAK